MARMCDSCDRLIRQRDDEFLELQVRVLDATAGEDQDAKARAHGDFCDQCLRSGLAFGVLLDRVQWKFEEGS